MTAQVKTKYGKAETAMRCAAFVKGFKEARAGKPLNYEAFPVTNDQWNYERGRQFALIFDGALKNGAKLTWQARDAMQDALVNQFIR
jgi:hypothetical protein